MGKSAAMSILESHGVPILCTDRVAHDLVEPGKPALDEVAAAFGPGIVAADGRLRRDELARMVFSDESARARLEGILHPRIRQMWQASIADWRAKGAAAGVVVIPLLFETSAEREFDATICICCSAATQQSRLLSRGWTKEQIAQRIAAQLPAETKMSRADYVAWSEGPMEVLADQLRRIVGW